MDLILRNARLPDAGPDAKTDVGIENGRIAAIAPALPAAGTEIDLQGRLLSPGFVETHIHLDKSRILDRCRAERGELDEAIAEVAKAKKAFTAEDVYDRARRTLRELSRLLGEDVGEPAQRLAAQGYLQDTRAAILTEPEDEAA